jgi:hypothetical protein
MDYALLFHGHNPRAVYFSEGNLGEGLDAVVERLRGLL